MDRKTEEAERFNPKSSPSIWPIASIVMKGFALTIDAAVLSILLIVLHGCLTFLVLFKKSF
jgi:hypothetical protein